MATEATESCCTSVRTLVVLAIRSAIYIAIIVHKVSHYLLRILVSFKRHSAGRIRALLFGYISP